MPSCFWSLCDCPEEQPCPEHDGRGCSLIGGKTIEKETDVDDAITRATEAAIARLEKDKVRLDEIKKKLEDHKAQLEKERADLERQAQAAATKAQRQAVVDEERAIEARHAQLDTEIRALVNEIDALGSSYITASTVISGALSLPYSDPEGYCACYGAKLADLNRLSNAIAAEKAILAAATAAFNAAKAAALPKLKFTFTIAFGVFLFVFIMFGGLYGLVVAAFISLMFTAITVLGLAIQMGVRKNALLVSRIALLKLWLSYYRIQRIPTCVREEDEDCCADGGEESR